jgi:dolichol-phosphate mannosyltransferase
MCDPARPLVVIPTYNERENVAQLIPAILGVNSRLHILIVDDGSPDDTAGAVSELKDKDYPSRLFLQCRSGKLGLGSAYVHGLKWGLAKGYTFLIQMDADWSHHPRHLERMLELAQESDYVVGSRYVPEGGTLNWGAGRKLLSRFASFYSRLILGVNFADFTGGFNGWSSSVLRRINLDSLKSDGYSFQIEMKYRAHRLGYRHVEFPILFNERRAGKSKMSAAIALEACWRVWQLRLITGETGQPMAVSPGPIGPATAPAETQGVRHDPAFLGESPD